MHCYSTYFFQILIGLGTLPIYNCMVVQNWSSNIDGVSSVFHLIKTECTGYYSG